MLIKNNRLLKQSNFKLEKDIQSFVEKHIPDILGEEYEFVCTFLLKLSQKMIIFVI